jgi:ssDNA-binding Zn-finger/Zn-ribbon topoisomerase 1
MARKRFATSLSCPRCQKISARIFDELLSEELLEESSAYIFLGWIACPKENCRNYFHKENSVSRCPVCKLWSVKLINDAYQKKWACVNKECEWHVELLDIS